MSSARSPQTLDSLGGFSTAEVPVEHIFAMIAEFVGMLEGEEVDELSMKLGAR